MKKNTQKKVTVQELNAFEVVIKDAFEGKKFVQDRFIEDACKWILFMEKHTWLFGSFFKRSFAILGYVSVAYGIILIGLLLLGQLFNF